MCRVSHGTDIKQYILLIADSLEYFKTKIIKNIKTTVFKWKVIILHECLDDIFGIEIFVLKCSKESAIKRTYNGFRTPRLIISLDVFSFN